MTPMGRTIYPSKRITKRALLVVQTMLSRNYVPNAFSPTPVPRPGSSGPRRVQDWNNSPATFDMLETRGGSQMISNDVGGCGVGRFHHHTDAPFTNSYTNTCTTQHRCAQLLGGGGAVVPTLYSGRPPCPVPSRPTSTLLIVVKPNRHAKTDRRPSLESCAGIHTYHDRITRLRSLVSSAVVHEELAMTSSSICLAIYRSLS